MERLTASGPVLVHFFDFAQLNAVRTLPYLRAWQERYSQHGLAVLGVHTPRYPFSEDPAAVAAAVERLGIPYPVVSDETRAIWADYGCHGWPSLFLWSKGGALRWYHFGEGEYRATEEAIQAELPEGPMPEPLEPMRPGDAPGAQVIAPTPELLPGGSEREPWRATGAQPTLEIEFAAAGAAAALDGRGRVEVLLDGEPRPALAVDHPGLYELAPEGAHREHRLELRPGPDVQVFAISFAAGVLA
ncbi:MAG: redoxin domain-containing protein [Solirubrobacterales bacterium]